MNYIYSALMLHSAGKPVNEENVKKVVSAIEHPDEAKIKALVSALEGVNIEETISKAAMPVAVAAPVASASAPAAAKEEHSEEEAAKKAEEAAGGLASLFG